MTRKPKQKKETKKQKEEVVEVASESSSNEPIVKEELNLGEKVKAEFRIRRILKNPRRK